VREAFRPDDIHVPRSRLLILEQTSNLAGGRVLPLAYLEEVRALTAEVGLHFHLDGARLFNAVVASGVSATEYAACADTVMFCFSKGLGAPAGSVLCGPAALIAEGRRVRKLLGGGMRQGGVLAACALHALEHNIERLAEDHENARRFAGAIEAASIPGIAVDPPETNMVYVRPRAPASLAGWAARSLSALERRGVRAVSIFGASLRFVFHKDVSREDAEEAAPRVVLALAEASAGAATGAG
jgi:threonine aldolase